jgi:uncharacterized protein
MAHATVERYRQAMDKLEQGDTTAMMDLVSDDVVWHEAGRAEPFRGKDAVMQRMSGMTDVLPHVTLVSVLGDDDHLAVHGHAQMQRNGESCEYDFVEEMALRDGRVTERWSFMDAVPDDVARFFADA